MNLHRSVDVVLEEVCWMHPYIVLQLGRARRAAGCGSSRAAYPR
jgi:hypothetical protein